MVQKREASRWMAPVILTAMGVLVMAVMTWGASSSAARQSSDLFWSLAWVDGVQSEGYESAQDIYANTDAVVLGRLTDITPGRVIGDPSNDNAAFYATVTLEIERVLRSRPGALPSGNTIDLEVVSFQEPVIGMMVDAFAPERGLYFLTSKGLAAARAGAPADEVASESQYYRLAVADGVIRDIGGRARTRPSQDRSLFEASNGLLFESVVTDIADGS